MNTSAFTPSATTRQIAILFQLEGGKVCVGTAVTASSNTKV